MSAPPKSSSRLPLHLDSELCFVLPDFLAREFEYARSLEQGIMDNLHPEFTHQYRVTLRRMRSLCVLLSEVIPCFELAILKPHLKTLMKQTNLLRDLDVFTLDTNQYLVMLPEQHSSLTRIFADIDAMKNAEQVRVASWLASLAYQTHCAMVRNSLERTKQYDLLKNDIELVTFANQKIANQFRKVNKSQRKISPASKDDVIHTLRIKCKALRYLLECFSALYPAQQHKENVTQLKLLQDKLGDFNDTSTQIAFFTQLRKDKRYNKPDRQVLKSLIKEIKQAHEQSRQSTLLRLKSFDSFINDASTLEIYR
ncbi:CHAD domain-containing protein [Vibrio parahaemolyticus]|uniref:CHAD domain-containing protein n=1 Tax=Vibrio parahaemolyticus TaxID=670 RepID=UPI0009961842|nr:CHAD domain-containing protein [Vibrio parahaemolyticus]EGQ8003797.1 CHAD domain-containing protein [Vibrio parahaemolyticus]EHH2481365.1 CHAD domain-containing protein [Vibrio parahaemolyticus]EIV8498871.1 CHAD domain-containing protein [Vibrio parahaemolyticus]EJG0103874.1 CHAD domain-containing protein [Vibrio parahaemolyticus]EJG0563853.1 CHAD domain-containing protein [Vibrio parahaemolyticus]